MKQFFNLLCLTAVLTSGFALQAVGPRPKGTPASSPHMPAALKNQITALSTALQNDDVQALKTFITKNKNFQWNEIYSNLPWTVEAQTPLSAAAWLGALKCVQHLLKDKTLNITESFNIPSSKNPKYTPLHYAQNPPAEKYRKYPHQKNANYTKIVNLLKKHGEKK